MARQCLPPTPAKDSTFESECVALIQHLEAVHLVRAQGRLQAAQRAVQVAKTEIDCLRAAIKVFREVNADLPTAPGGQE